MDPRGIELINLELDGRLDEAGREELARLLAAEPALAEHRQQLRELVLELRSAPAPALPADFRDQVLAKARLPQRNIRHLRARRAWRSGFALAASVLAVAVVLRFAGPTSAPDHLSGTLAPAVPSVSAETVADGLKLTFDLPAGPPGDLVIDFTDGRRIVMPRVQAGRTTVQVAGGAGDFSAVLVRGEVSTPVERRTP
jgi:ferric-dicitrate binding protein FerR (iron transport regulator)